MSTAIAKENMLFFSDQSKLMNELMNKRIKERVIEKENERIIIYKTSKTNNHVLQRTILAVLSMKLITLIYFLFYLQ